MFSSLSKSNFKSKSLPNDNLFDWTKFKAFADDKLNVAKIIIFFPLFLTMFQKGWVENIVGKGENAGHQHFLLFPQCFQMAFSSGSLKVKTVVKGTITFILLSVNAFTFQPG